MSRRAIVFAILTTAAIADCGVTGWHVLLAFITGDSAAFFGWLAGGGITLVLLIVAAGLASGQRDPYRTSREADPREHLAPLLTAHPTEDTLTTDLRQRRMLLRPRGLTEHMANILAGVTERRALRLRRLHYLGTEDVPGRDEIPAPASVGATSVGEPPRPAGDSVLVVRGKHRGQPKGRKPEVSPVPAFDSGPVVPVTAPGPAPAPIGYPVPLTDDPAGVPLAEVIQVSDATWAAPERAQALCPVCECRLLTSGGLHCAACGWLEPGSEVAAEFGEHLRTPANVPEHEEMLPAPLPEMPADQDDPGPLYSWVTGEFSRAMLLGEPAKVAP